METTAKKKLDDVLNFFSGNPFSTPVGQKIEEATDGNLECENWQLNMEITDLINSSEEHSKDALRAIKKRLVTKNYTSVMYTLIVLETCVKNCCERFISQVMTREFLMEHLVRILAPRNEPPCTVTEKVLSLIQSFADNFKEKYPQVWDVYEDLKCKGIEFPPTDFDAMAPILTPKRSVIGETRSPSSDEPILHPVHLGPLAQVQVSPSELKKLTLDLDQVQTNLTVFNEILGEPNCQEDEAFLEDLHKSCTKMQERLTHLLGSNLKTENEEIIGQMLHLNDELNNVFLRYGRYKKNVNKSSTNSELIDFGQQQGDLLGATGGEVENQEEILKTHTEADFNEMETWLKTNPPKGSKKKEEDEGLSSSDFDSFLAERVAAASLKK